MSIDGFLARMGQQLKDARLKREQAINAAEKGSATREIKAVEDAIKRAERKGLRE